MWEGKTLRIFAYTATTSDLPLFSVTVSKKYSPYAHKRNNMKRAVYEEIGLHIGEYSAKGYEKFIVHPRGVLGDNIREAVRNDLQDFIKALKNL